MTPRRPETPAEKEMRERDLPAGDLRGEDQLPLDQPGLRHPRPDGVGGLPDPAEGQPAPDKDISSDG